MWVHEGRRDDFQQRFQVSFPGYLQRTYLHWILQGNNLYKKTTKTGALTVVAAGMWSAESDGRTGRFLAREVTTDRSVWSTDSSVSAVRLRGTSGWKLLPTENAITKEREKGGIFLGRKWLLYYSLVRNERWWCIHCPTMSDCEGGIGEKYKISNREDDNVGTACNKISSCIAVHYALELGVLQTSSRRHA